MTAILLTANVLICIALVIIILLQRSDPSAGGMFGGTGGAGPAIRNPMAKTTAYLAAAFMTISLVIAYTSKGEGAQESVTAVHEGEAASAAVTPATPSTPAAADADLLAPVAATPEPAVPVQALPEATLPAQTGGQ